ncbi:MULTISPECIES: hypothetical protein [unclassified Chryseobacterium]|uniref:hypothetical protein n=1 Tax=unclassified Chryseobacterium TaxID=2593645 RepID=UPI000A73C5BA|nr:MULTISPECIES: hypothetical protein [unclassified Chryseobacterium]
MKTLFTIPAIIFASFISTQEKSLVITYNPAAPQSKNIIKTNLTAYAFKKINLTH